MTYIRAKGERTSVYPFMAVSKSTLNNDYLLSLYENGYPTGTRILAHYATEKEAIKEGKTEFKRMFGIEPTASKRLMETGRPRVKV